MKNQFHLDITTPCSENFNQFSPTSNGGFCGSCEKEVIDFSVMTTEDIITFFKTKATQNTCGRFNNNQLKTYNVESKKNKRIGFITAIGLTCLAFFSSFTAQAQDTVKAIAQKNNKSEIKASKFVKNIVVKGNVTENDMPLPGANVVLEGTTIGVATDFDGTFEFSEKLKIGDILIISYIGMESQKIVIENKDADLSIALNIDMKADACIIMGKVAVKDVYKSKRN